MVTFGCGLRLNVICIATEWLGRWLWVELVVIPYHDECKVSIRALRISYYSLKVFLLDEPDLLVNHRNYSIENV